MIFLNESIYFTGFYFFIVIDTLYKFKLIANIYKVSFLLLI